MCELRLTKRFALLLLPLSMTIPAQATRIVIDNSDTPMTPCVIGTPCATTTIPFSVDFGFGAFDSLYIYNNGLVSIGSEIATGSDLTSLASIGGNVFTAGYSPETVLTDFAVQDPGLASFDFPGKPVFRVRYKASFDDIIDMPMEFSIFDLGGSNYALQFNHGPAFDPDEPDIAEDAYLGYAFSSGNFLAQSPALQSDVQGELVDFQFLFGPDVTPSVPEPASWLMMIAGFGLAGSALRRRSAMMMPA